MKVTFLGTGTSTGVPAVGCHCETCESADPRDKRLRCSAFVETQGKSLLIDCGPDLRTQLLNNHIEHIDALLITHSHYDHVGGIDDMRPFCHRSKYPFPTYCQADVADDLRARVPYCFREHLYPGVPTFNLHAIEAGEPFKAAEIEVLPLRIWHGHLPILGFHIGNMAYITDAKTIPQATLDALHGIDTLIINALRLKDHPTHMSLSETLEAINRIKPRQAYLTHMSDGMPPHAKVKLPMGVELAYDGLQIEI